MNATKFAEMQESIDEVNTRKIQNVNTKYENFDSKTVVRSCGQTLTEKKPRSSPVLMYLRAKAFP